METARTVKLTGEPVSREMEDIIRRLNNNERVDIEEINATREITVARSVVNYSTPTDMLENRGEIRKNALNILMESGSAVLDENGRVSYNGNVKREARFDVVLGLPASGKSSSLCDKISEEFGSRIIDNDEAKKLLPEYNNGWGAGVVHDESQRVSEAQLEICLTSKENIVFPKVGGNLRKIEKTIRKAKRYGYKVYVHYVDLSRNKALGRMLSRFIETGRFLSPDLIEKYDNVREGNRILNTYNKLKERCDFNGRNDEGTMFMSAGIRGYGNIREGRGGISQSNGTSVGASRDVGKSDIRGMGPVVYQNRLRAGEGGPDRPVGIQGFGGERAQVLGIREEELRGMDKNDAKGTAYHNKEDIQRGTETVEEPLIDGFSMWDNDVGFGEKPMLVEASCNGKFIEEGKKNTAFMKNVMEEAKNSINAVGFPKHYEPYVESIIQHAALAYQEKPDVSRTDVIIGYENPKQDISFLTAGMNIAIKSMDTNTENVAADVKNICNTYRELGFKEVRFHYINDSKRLMCPQKNEPTSGEITFDYVKHSCLADGYTCHIAQESNLNKGEIKPTVNVNGYGSKIQNDVVKEVKRQ